MMRLSMQNQCSLIQREFEISLLFPNESSISLISWLE